MSSISTFTPSRWDLTDLYSSQEDPQLQFDFDQIEKLVSEFEQHRARLASQISPAEFMEIVSQLEKINLLAYRIYGYSSLRFAADTQDQAAQALLARVEQFLAGMENRTLFFSLWWKGLDNETAERLMAGTGDYHYWLEEMRNFKEHTLSEPEEKIVNIKNVTGVNALGNLYDQMTSRYTFKLAVDGEEKDMTRGEIMVYARHHDPDLRALAYQELYRVYGQEGPVLAYIYQTLVRDWRNEQVELRRFNSPIAARNLLNDIPDEVTDTLLGVCKNNAALFQRFFRIKADLLGLERLRRYDIYAPVARSEKTYSFGDAAEMVLNSFEMFDTRFAGMARRIFESEHMDSQVRKGKRDGAFCMSVTPGLTPWVLLNFQGRPDDVATMAHELGHAVHAMLSDHHNIFTYHPSLPLAETASTFGEMALVDHLLSREGDEAVRRELLFRQVDGAYATIMRQAFFALFERQAHEMIYAGASIDELCAAYMENLKRQFGDAVEVSEEFRWEWVSIPHIFQVPFYVYAYAFGQLLVLSLYQQYKEVGEAFKPRYLDILSAGGSNAPAKVLSAAGIDIYSAEFWQGGFDVVANLLNQLAEVAGDHG
jgi:oligoendopeptidase F